VLFYEYFNGDTGAGVGASHQTGWTGCIARIMQANAMLTPELLLTPGALDVPGRPWVPANGRRKARS
jgi:hypothetical protein